MKTLPKRVHAGDVVLAVSEYRRPIIYVAEYYYRCLPGTAVSHVSSSCVFSTREEAVRWAKFEMRGDINWDEWTAPTGTYPNETNRDDVNLSPTFIATVEHDGILKRVTVTRNEVNQEFDWWAPEADGNWNRRTRK